MARLLGCAFFTPLPAPPFSRFVVDGYPIFKVPFARAHQQTSYALSNIENISIYDQQL